ncbi:hypothetical protein OCF84_20695 (plasmid) [Shewanella xiamenensis]|uniref:Uncharacterized protein n=1 Tax=Shewanella xiamenensis TaxID=332186 RepID=A0ABT6UFR9_9GAMM|nr:hypothetical protein [Shewanella xiamenensis]MDI5833312.1 hypothetical protein [Shewanella xiamenensis]WHF57937.1 hypothetical protein OCF84_20695 [Shewanella xiamenensis]
MTINKRSIPKKIGVWLIRPSIFNISEGASNPFHDAIKLFKSAKAVSEKKSLSEITHSSIAKKKHKAMIDSLMKIPIEDRQASASTQTALSILIAVLWVIGLFVAYSPLMFSINTTSPVINLIINHFTIFFHFAATIFTLVMLYSFVSYRWRASLFKSPLQSCDFLTYLASPKRW